MTSTLTQSGPISPLALLHQLADRLVACPTPGDCSHRLWHPGLLLASHCPGDAVFLWGTYATSTASSPAAAIAGVGGRSPAALVARVGRHCRCSRRCACFRLARHHRAGVVLVHRRMGDDDRRAPDRGRDRVTQGHDGERLLGLSGLFYPFRVPLVA